jgi:uncharacterized protein YdeI (YjbR/CyaY-like superfamily)
MKKTDTLPVIAFDTQRDWEAWLEENHTEARGIWLKIAKKDAGARSVSYAQALDSALCYGWIDGQKAGLDERYWLQKFTPRGPRSVWSQVNRDKVTALIAEGKLQPAGLRQVELAKADGRWDSAYASQSAMSIPDDLQRALDNDPEASAFFSALDSANRYAILWRIHMAKRPETRAARIRTFVDMLAKHEKLHP